MANLGNVRVMNELEVLNAALAVGWVKFSYYKADGTKRIAIGTRNISLIEQIVGKRVGGGTKRATNYFENCNGYFDLTRVDWRKFNSNRFIGMEFGKLSNEQAATIALTIAVGFSDCNEYATLSAVEKLVSRTFALSLIKIVEREIECDDDFDDCERVISVVGAIIPQCKISVNVEQKCDTREKLIAELRLIRKREEEILTELLYRY